MKEGSIRETVCAGSFYPAEPEELISCVDRLLEDARVPRISSPVKLLVCPHAGYIYSGRTAAFSYKLLRAQIAKRKMYPRKIFLLGPSHQYSVEGLCVSDVTYWKTPLGEVPLSPIAKTMTQRGGIFSVNRNAHAVEHSLEVQLPFLQRVYEKNEFEIIPILISGTSVKEAVRALSECTDDESLILVSTDLSHYHSQDEAKERDSATIDSLLRLDGNDLKSTGDACGLESLLIAVEYARINSLKGMLLDYRTSGDTAGDRKAVVGYASLCYYPSP